METSPLERFSNRVDNYVRYRPGYPPAIIDFLSHSFQLSPSHSVADVGSGTGISSELFLKNGNRVTGIEPNAAMRERSTLLLSVYPLFEAIDGTAEHTTLAADSVDFIIAGQAFHWFDRDSARKEFTRILRKDGVIALIWNERLTDDLFSKRYDQLIVEHGIDYAKVDHRQIDDEAIEQFFSPAPVTVRVFSNQQVFDFDGLKGRLLSSSYVPDENHPGYQAMIDELKKLFDAHQQNGRIVIRYATKVYAGRAF